jgi:hypothetical protein
MSIKTPIKGIKTAAAIKRILMELCHSHYKSNNSDLDNRIEKFWEVLRGTPFFKRRDVGVALRGGPGQGKTTAFKVASKMFADAVGLDFKMNPSDEELKQLNDKGELPNCFIFVSHEMGGEVSSMSMGGIPSKEKMGDTEYMTKLPMMKFAVMKYAGGGCLLLDDLANAGASVRNVALSILEEKRYQSLDIGNAFVGLTGNLGAADGTNISPTSGAESTRVQTFLVQDTVEDWVMRTNDEFKDELGDALLGSFLLKSIDSTSIGRNLFNAAHNRKDGSPFPCSRTWSKLVEQIRGYYGEARFLMKKDAPFDHLQEDIVLAATGIVGIEAGEAVGTYYHNVLTGALPLAIKQMETGLLDGKDLELMKKMVGAKKNAPEGAYFAVQYANTLSDEASFRVNELFKSGKSMSRDKDEFKVVLKNYVDGVYNYGLHQGSIAQNMACFKDKMIIRSDSRRQVGFVNSDGLTVVADEFSKLMSEVVGQNYIANQPIPETPTVKLLEDTFVSVFANSAAAFNSFDEGQDSRSVKEQAELLEIQKAVQNLKAEYPKLNEIRQTDVKSDNATKEVVNRVIQQVEEKISEAKNAEAEIASPVKPQRRMESGSLDSGMFSL